MKTRYANTAALLTALLCIWQTPPLLAQILPGVDTISGDTALVSGNGGLTLGWIFRVSAPGGIMANGLGFWDYHSDGFTLGQTFDVGLWNSSTGKLLAESVVTSSSTLLPSMDSAGGWRMNSIPSLFLAPGDYRIGALMPVNGANQILIDPGTFQSAPGINFEGFERQIGSSTLAMPDIGPPYPSAIWFGPTFTFTPVPEPSLISLLVVGLSLSWVFGVIKEKARKRAGSQFR